MPLQVDAVYENGVLRPLQPLDLKEHERVVVSVEKAASTPVWSSMDIEYVEKLKRELEGAEPAPGLEEVRRRLGKIPGSMAADVIAERGGSLILARLLLRFQRTCQALSLGGRHASDRSASPD